MHFAVVLGGLAVGLLNFGDKVRALLDPSSVRLAASGTRWAGQARVLGPCARP